jgi:hypothetical protein
LLQVDAGFRPKVAAPGLGAVAKKWPAPPLEACPDEPTEQ